MVTMLVDHVGHVFYPGESGWRIIGRLAFPIYAYYLVVGHRHTKSVSAYMNRLLLLAILSQIPFMIAFDELAINVIATLYLSLAMLVLMERTTPWISIPAAMVAAIMMELFRFDYASYGLFLVLIYRYTQGMYTVLAHFVLTLLYIRIMDYWSIQLVSVLATAAIVWGPKINLRMERKMVPKWLWRSFYPVHLACIAVGRWMG